MRILVLSTWFPYPLSQGSKIRAYYLIKSLAQRHDVALISFQDTLVETSAIDHMRQICQKVEIVPHNPFVRLPWRSILGWLSLKPSVVQTSYSLAMRDRVQQLVADWEPYCVIALTFITAPYALQIRNVRKKMVDIDNLMSPMLYHDYQQTRQPLGRFRHWLAYWKFQRYETWLYRQFDLGLVVSEQDRRAAINLGLHASQVSIVPNGVDTSMNHPISVEPKPNTLIFNGALTYSANYDAMDYFLREVFPLIRTQVPDAHLTITGSTTGVPVGALPINGNVTFSGYMNDIRTTVSSSWVCIVPLRIGGGTRLKILEAMALGTPVVSTAKGAEGLDVEHEKHILIGDTPREFAKQTVRVLREPELRNLLSQRAAQLVRERYDWADIGRQFCELVEIG